MKFDVYENVQRCKISDLRPINYEWPEEPENKETNPSGDSGVDNQQSDIPFPNLQPPESASPELKQLLSAWYTAGYYAGRFDKQLDPE